MQQQIYCSAQFAYEQIRHKQELAIRLDAIEEAVAALRSDMAGFSHSESVINPLEKATPNGAGVAE